MEEEEEKEETEKEDERGRGWQRRVEESKLSDGGWVGSGNGERNKKELAGNKKKAASLGGSGS